MMNYYLPLLDIPPKKDISDLLFPDESEYIERISDAFFCIFWAIMKNTLITLY